MEFWKMNGAGNDFIVVDDRQDAIPDEKWPEIIRTVCERHMSIGADGFMVVKKPTYGGGYENDLAGEVQNHRLAHRPAACGTGTGSVVTVLTLLDKVSGKSVRVDMTGGTLTIDVERDSAGHVTDLFLTGPTNIVCKGEITDEALDPSLLSM